MSTETKVVSGIVLVTILIIIGGIFAINKQSNKAASVTIKPDLVDRADAPRAGSSTKVIITEFADFECPACAVLSPELKRLLETDGDKFTLVYRHFPIHSHSYEAAAVALAAGEQGKFFQMSEVLFDKQSEWTPASANRTTLFEKYATQLGLDIAKFRVSVKDPKHEESVNKDRRDATAMGINSTPTLIINGTEAVRGAIPYETLRKLVLEAYNATGTSALTSASSTR
ncbi:MAG: hypothetical protein RL094_646 [Candidatus Parcubacteria bacterium]|jgi:protein-disulfide isomerase